MHRFFFIFFIFDFEHISLNIYNYLDDAGCGKNLPTDQCSVNIVLSLCPKMCKKAGC